jgi:hypothetical protein
LLLLQAPCHAAAAKLSAVPWSAGLLLGHLRACLDTLLQGNCLLQGYRLQVPQTLACLLLLLLLGLGEYLLLQQQPCLDHQHHPCSWHLLLVLL